MPQKKVRLGKADMAIRGCTYVVLSLGCVICIVPFLLVLGSSFASEESIRTSGFVLFPTEFSTAAYEIIFRSPEKLLGSYVVTILLTLIGTLLGMLITAMTGYALSRKDFPFRNQISFFIYFTSLFPAGLVPFFLLMVQTYHLRNNYLAVLLPLLTSPWLVMLMKNFAKCGSSRGDRSGKD